MKLSTGLACKGGDAHFVVGGRLQRAVSARSAVVHTGQTPPVIAIPELRGVSLE